MLNKIHQYFLLSQGVSSMNYFKELFSDGSAKFISCLITGAFSWVAGSFTPLWTVLFILLLIILIDAYLGGKIAFKNQKKFESRRLWKTLHKFGWCGAIIWFANQIDANILVSIDAHLVEFFAGLIAGVELWSVIENLATLYPDGPWKLLNKFIRKKGEKYLDITIDREDLPKIRKLVKKIK